LASLVARDRAPGLTLVGVGTRDWSDRRWQDRVRDSFAEADDESDEAGRAALDDMRKHTSYRKVDVTAPGELARLVKSVEAPVALYFALPPAVTERACELLTAADLPEGTDWRSHHDARQFY
jgi:glucose-6-phosphate 1-dehydrogenase